MAKGLLNGKARPEGTWYSRVPGAVHPRSAPAPAGWAVAQGARRPYNQHTRIRTSNRPPAGPSAGGRAMGFMNLFKSAEDAAIRRNAPLAVRMRPRTLDEIPRARRTSSARASCCGGCSRPNRLTSLVFYGPPGTRQDHAGPRHRRALRLRVPHAQRRQHRVKEVREIIEQARAALASTGRRTVLFIDELHRFNRAQQDVLLDDVENGIVILIGATTENPFFAINSPLLSRSHDLPVQPADARRTSSTLLRRALADARTRPGRLHRPG